MARTGKKASGASGREKGQGAVLLEWQHRIKMLNNRELWRNILLGFGVPSLFMGGIFGWIGRVQDGLWLGLGLLLFFLLIFLLIGLMVDLAGGFEATFRLTTGGVGSQAGKASRKAVNAVAVAGFLMRSLSTAGAGLLAKGEQDVFIPWTAIRRIAARPRDSFILVRGAFGEKPIGLYCTPRNYDQVLDILKNNPDPGELQRSIQSARFMGKHAQSFHFGQQNFLWACCGKPEVPGDDQR